MKNKRSLSRYALASLFALAGIMHFLHPHVFAASIPAVLPWKYELVYASGICEIAGAIGLLLPGSCRLAGQALILLLLAVFPANINMAINADQFSGINPILLWSRLPIQILLIVWLDYASKK